MVQLKPLVSIVDDDETIRAATRYLVESFGYNVEAFESADAFLTSRRMPETCCLIADVQMPKTSGFELHRQLAEAGIQIPIIFITAFPTDTARNRALKAGAIAYVTKPFNGATLLEHIKKAVSRDN